MCPTDVRSGGFFLQGSAPSTGHFNPWQYNLLPRVQSPPLPRMQMSQDLLLTAARTASDFCSYPKRHYHTYEGDASGNVDTEKNRDPKFQTRGGCAFLPSLSLSPPPNPPSLALKRQYQLVEELGSGTSASFPPTHRPKTSTKISSGVVPLVCPAGCARFLPETTKNHHALRSNGKD